MKYGVKLTERAEDDLRNIYEYIARVLLVPGIAASQLERIEDGILNLEEMPERFRIYEKEPWYSRGIHQMPVNNFIIFYTAEKDKKSVTVIRILYGGMDIDEQLNNTEV